MKTCVLQIEGLKEVLVEMEQLQQEGNLDAIRLNGALVNAKLFLYEISLQCKAKYVKLVEAASAQLDLIRKNIQNPVSAELIESVSAIISDFLFKAQATNKKIKASEEPLVA